MDPLLKEFLMSERGSTISTGDPVSMRERPLVGSPLKYTVPLTDLAYDVDGRARNNPTSIGAYEYVEPRASRL